MNATKESRKYKAKSRVPFWATIFTLLVFSCHNVAKHDVASNSSSATALDEKYQFASHLKTGIKYHYTINTETETTIEVNDKKVETDNQARVNLTYEVIKDSADVSNLKITYEKLHITIKKTGAEDQALDSDGDPGNMDPVERTLSIIKGSSLIVTLNSKGDVLNIAGTKEISDKIMSLVLMEDPKIKEMITQIIFKLAGPGFIEDNLKREFKLFPDSALHVGDKWSRKDNQSADLSFEVNSKCTLASLEDGLAVINTEGQISNNKNATSKMLGYDVTADLAGTQSGEFRTDVSTGIMVSGKSTTSINGSVQVAGKEASVKIKIKKEITGKKM